MYYTFYNNFQIHAVSFSCVFTRKAENAFWRFYNNFNILVV